ncbi:MAG: septum site-determining protein MinC [Anaerolineae bacterium]|nr:septum site-determining protein MinC [Anaerolineae bacterium]
MIQEAQQLRIKGIREGLLITTSTEGSFGEMCAQVEAELQQKGAFFQGSRVALQVESRPLSKAQILQLQRLFIEHNLELWAILADDAHTRTITRDLDLAIRLAGSQTDLDGNALAQSPEPASNGQASAPNENGTNVLLLHETIRSGRSILHEGHVVIMGDVNAGAEIIAGGDVLVWGRLRGLVHAGAMGDDTAVICALDLNPTQLRIANQIAIAPHDAGRIPYPEQASIKDGQIIAERWKSGV